jgi:hypothetical protein
MQAPQDARRKLGSEAMDTDKVRRSFRPDRVTILFVGESPPAGGTFFYCANSQLFYYTQNAFSHALEVGCADFLTQFRSLGCYLDDLVLVPIDRKCRRDRERAHKEGVASLADRIRSLSPYHVVVIGKGIRPQVEEAVKLSGIKATFDCVPFPANHWQNGFVEQMTVLLPRLLDVRHRPSR